MDEQLTFVKPIPGELQGYTAFKDVTQGAERRDAPRLLTGGQLSQETKEKGIPVPGSLGASPPTGVSLRVDWLSLTFPRDDGWVRTIASAALGSDVRDWTELDYGGMGYRHGAVGPGGARLFWGATGREDVHLSLPGQACGLIGQERTLALMRAAVAHGAKATRVDLALDDYDRSVGVFEVYQAVDEGEAVTRARDWLLIVAGRVGEQSLRKWEATDFAKGWQESVRGATFYMGSPSSRQRLRVYDKNKESKGEINSIRWELQARDDAAETLLEQLAAEDTWGDVARARYVAFVDFRKASDDHHTERRKRTPWYERLMGLVKRVAAYLPMEPKSFEEAYDWFLRAIGPLAWVVEKRLGVPGLTVAAQQGGLRVKPRHYRLAGLRMP